MSCVSESSGGVSLDRGVLVLLDFLVSSNSILYLHLCDQRKSSEHNLRVTTRPGGTGAATYELRPRKSEVAVFVEVMLKAFACESLEPLGEVECEDEE